MLPQVGLRSILVATTRCVPPAPIFTSLRLDTHRSFSSGGNSIGICERLSARGLLTGARFRASAAPIAFTKGRTSTPQRSRPLRLLEAPSQSSTQPLRRGFFSTSSRHHQSSFPHGTFRSMFFQRPDRALDEWMFWSIVTLNLLVFIVWNYAGEVWRIRGDWTTYAFMTRNFMNSEVNLKEGRYWTLLTACFSHEMPIHFMINMASLAFMGLPVINIIGAASFASLYVGAGIVANLGSLAWHRWGDPWVVQNGGQGHRKPASSVKNGYSYGASGAVYAIVTSFACLAPKATFLLAFIIPIPAWMCVTGLFGYDLWKTWTNPEGSREDTAGHVSGILAGLLFWRFRLRGRVTI